MRSYYSPNKLSKCSMAFSRPGTWKRKNYRRREKFGLDAEEPAGRWETCEIRSGIRTDQVAGVTVVNRANYRGAFGKLRDEIDLISTVFYSVVFLTRTARSALSLGAVDGFFFFFLNVAVIQGCFIAIVLVSSNWPRHARPCKRRN